MLLGPREAVCVSIQLECASICIDTASSREVGAYVEETTPPVALFWNVVTHFLVRCH